MDRINPNKYLNREELVSLRQHVQKEARLARIQHRRGPIIDEIIVEILAGSGVRAAELLNLRIGDLPHKHHKPVIWIRNGKGNIKRDVAISKNLTEKLKFFCLYARRNAGKDDYLLTNKSGKPMIYRTLYEKFRKLGRKLGMELHPHMMRHTYLTRFYNATRDIRATQIQAGHKSVQTTEIYSHICPETRFKQAELIE